MVTATPIELPPGYVLVEPGTEDHTIVQDELKLLAAVQKSLAERQLADIVESEFEKELVSLRDQIADARLEDVAPLVAEMYRLQALGSRTGNGRSLPVDVNAPYFGHLRLKEGNKVRDVLVGNRGFMPAGAQGGFAIVDWRNAPVSRIYYRYEEGDDYEENFGGRPASGTVLVRRTVSIIEGELRRITWPEGSVAKRKDGSWVRTSHGEKPTLRGGQGIAARPGVAAQLERPKTRGKLGVVGDESLREDKHLQAITALIDKHQFDMITKPDSGIVILQGGAGSGKTTVALHRAAYLAFNAPQIFSPKKMAIVVKSPALTEYIARVLPSLGVEGTKCFTLGDWMEKTRKKVLPELKFGRIEEAPAAVARVKKHPAVLHLMERAVADEADAIGEELVERAASAPAKAAVKKQWSLHGKLALVPRMREMQKWLQSAQAQRAGLGPRDAADCQGVLRRAKSPAQDVMTMWGQVLTDGNALFEAIEARSPGMFARAEIDEVVRYVTLQAEELDVEDEDEDEADDEASEKAERAQRREREDAADALGVRRGGGLSSDDVGVTMGEEEEGEGGDDDALARGVGVDGRQVDDDSPRGKLDEHDDPLLLRLVQLKQGSLPLPGSQKTIQYEHLIVDEAQDLSPTDISVLRGVLTKRESMTLAGDTAQKLIFDNGFDDWKSLLKDLGISGVELEPLRISYRSTREVTQFSRAVLGPLADPVEPITPRSGSPVEHFNFGTTGEAMAFVAEALRSLVMRERRASCAVIARYAAQANTYYEGLRNAEVPSLRRVLGKEFSFEPGIDVVDVTQIKGLEYDYVLLVETNASTYPEQMEARHLLHIASTRAVHQLWVTSVGHASPLLPDLDGLL
jgi:DNA helicase-2/ATP-dependent DNA helicase PcrA